MNRLRTAAALPVLAVLLAACSDSGERADTGERREQAPVDAGDRYVALGDSYTSAPGVGEDVGAPGCGQTSINYPHLLAERMELELVDASCGGATTSDLAGSQQPAGGAKVAPQLDSLTEDTALVTLGIGGNDDGVFGKLVFTCPQLAANDPDGAPCTEQVARAGNELSSDIEELADKIEDAVDEIRERAPRARVLVVGYPQIVPESGTCDQLPLAAGDYPFVRDVVEQMVQAQEDGAEAADAEYVDVWSATEGHDICADDPWIAGIRPEKPGLLYHPYAEHQDAVADLLAEKVSG